MSTNNLTKLKIVPNFIWVWICQHIVDGSIDGDREGVSSVRLIEGKKEQHLWTLLFILQILQIVSLFLAKRTREKKKQFSPCDLVGVNTSFTSCISFTLFVHNIPLCMSVDDCLCFLLKTPPFPFLRRLSPSLLCNAKMIIPNCRRNVWAKNCNFHSQIAHSMHPNNGVLSVLPFTTPEKKLFVPHKYLWRHVHKCPMHSGITNF